MSMANSLAFYRKGMKKGIVSGILPAVLLLGLVFLVAYVWPEFKTSAEEMQKLLESPMYKAFYGEDAIAVGIGSFEGFFGMTAFFYIDVIIIALSIFLGAGIIAREVDKKTLDISLSYPISRRSLLLGRFAAINTYALLLPLVVFLSIAFAGAYYGENSDLLALFLALLGKYALFFTLSALSLLCAALFLRPKASYGAAAGLILGSYILDSLGGLVESTEILANLSLFHYLDGTTIWASGTFPVDELAIVIGIGILALIAAVEIFQRRELTY
ncbi:MAG: ABC transporter permease [Candidatus Heimdallarchaeota archaeon]